MLFLTTLLISIIVTIALMPYAKELAYRLQAVDHPNHRKVHEHIMPKCGGMAMAVGAMTPVFLWAPMSPFVKGLMIGTLIIVLFGVADDIKDLSPYTKLLGQLMAALVAILVGGIKISDLGAFLPAGLVVSDWAAMPLTIFVIVGVTNATNLSDGLDGLAGGIALLIFLCIGYLGISNQDWVVAMVSIATGGAVFGFLRFNTHPAKLFMGDAGSQLLGFVAILLSIKLTQQTAQLSVILPLIILGLPILDTLTVMIRRLTKGRSPFAADRNHFHHQLIEIGLYHTEAVLTIYFTQSLLILFAIVCHQFNDWILLTAYICFAGLVVGSFFIFKKTGYRVNRDRFLNKIKPRLQPLKDRGQAIKFSFGIVKLGVPSLVLFNMLVPAISDETYFFYSGGLLILMALAWLVKKQLLDKTVKLILYLLTPFLIYRCDLWLHSYVGTSYIVVYNLLYLVLLSAVFLTMKLTRRANGFKSSTLDFLVIFIILLIPNLPNSAVTGYHLGLVAVKTVILFYSYEVLAGETRKKTISLPISIAIIFVAVKIFLVGL
jgi:UDP-GlcNAc:undecaprenyl-phosphate GlcNAc-1-phosphate transferase